MNRAQDFNFLHKFANIDIVTCLGLGPQRAKFLANQVRPDFISTLKFYFSVILWKNPNISINCFLAQWSSIKIFVLRSMVRISSSFFFPLFSSSSSLFSSSPSSTGNLNPRFLQIVDLSALKSLAELS